MSTKTQTLPKRHEVPVEKTWDLTPVYASEADWEKDFAQVESLIPGLAAYKGRVRRSGRLLLEALKLDEQIGITLGKLHTYAHLMADVDTADSKYQALNGRVRDLWNKVSQASSWLTPEILTIKPARLEKFIASNAGLEIYRHSLGEMSRDREHYRSPEVEELLAQAGRTFGGPGSIFGMFNNADLKLPEVADENGVMSRLTNGSWGAKWLNNPDRETRRRAYEAMFSTMNSWRNTLSATYAAQVKVDMFRANARRYPSCRNQALDGINVPESVYDQLIATVHANKDKLNAYLRMRQKAMGVDKLKWYDLYVPLVGELKYNISYPEAQQKVIASVGILGADYQATLRDGFASRWVDVVENEGKRSGAYSSGSYGTPPYMLMNWQDSMESMFTLAHEAGHSMHSWHSRKFQPYHYSGYTLFVAEVASTLNEALLAHYLINETDDKAVKRYILNQQMERIRQTLVRQTMFAEFESIAHAEAEKGTTLTPDVLCAIHLKLNKEYYGDVVDIDDSIGIEWARIPHFYNSFYVYQYATGISAAMALAHRIIKEGQPAVERYLGFLKSGSSKYSIDLLKDAGVDLTTPAPIQEAFDTFADYLTQFEALS